MKEKYKTSNYPTNIGKAALVAAILFGAYEGGAWGYNHLIKYRPGHEIPEENAIKSAQTKYDKAFTTANPAEKFTIQFLDTEFFDSTRYPNPEGFMTGDVPPVWETKYNNGCLAKSAYAINGGNISAFAEGLFSYVSVSANLPAAAAYAEINPTNPDQLIVESGHTNSVDLTFNGLNEDNLTPANSATIDILKTYGCYTGRIATYSTGYPRNLD